MKLYHICDAENPIEREETLLIFCEEKRISLELTTRRKSLKTAYEKFLSAFKAACDDGAIDALTARRISELIEFRPNEKLIEAFPHEDKPRALTYESGVSVFVDDTFDDNGEFESKFTFEDFGDDDGFYLLMILPIERRLLTSQEFSDETGIPRGTLKRWHHERKIIPVVVQRAPKPNFYSAEQIQQAIDLRKSLNQSKSTADDNQLFLFEEKNTMNQDVQDESKMENTEQAIVPAELSALPEIPATSAQIETIDVAAEVVTLDERANRIRQLQADVQRGIIEIGFELIAAKKEIGHGGWAQWLEKEFEWTQQTANRFMRVADRFGKLNNVVQFKPSTLQAMLTLPAGTEQEFIDEQKAQGKPVKTQSAREVQRNVKEFIQREKTAAAGPPAIQSSSQSCFVAVDDDENKLGLRLTAETSTPQVEVLPADVQAVTTLDEPLTADEFKTPLDSMRDDSQKVLDEIGELIHEADLTTLDATLKELLRIRDNLRGHVERKENANQQS